MRASRGLWALSVAASVSLQGCAMFGACDTAACVEDRKLGEEVSRQIDAHSSLRFFNITVRAHDHDIYLAGLVDTEVDRWLAGKVATDVPGVTHVYNGLELLGNGMH